MDLVNIGIKCQENKKENSKDYWHVAWVEVRVCRQAGWPWKNSPSPSLYLGGNKDIVHCSLGASAAFLAARHTVGPFSFTLAEGVVLGTGASTVAAG